MRFRKDGHDRETLLWNAVNRSRPYRTMVDDAKFSYLRNVVDGNDRFLHSQVKSSAKTSNGKRVRETPAWVNDDKFIQQMLSRAFPKMLTNKTQKQRAALWYQIINVWMRRGVPEGDAVREINEKRVGREITAKQLHDTVRRIREAAEGLPTRRKPIGRPRKRPLSDGPDEME
jgi:hypothetical protein